MLSIVYATVSAAAGSAPALAGFTPVEVQLNGKIEPANGAVWQTSLGQGGWWGTAPGQFNPSNAVAIGASPNSAELTSKYEAGYDPMASDGSMCNFTCGLEFGDHSTAILATTQTFTYGYFEASVTGVAAATGLRTSFWLQGADGEINIVDLFNVDGTTTANNDFHCWGGANDGTDVVSTANTADTTIDPSLGNGGSLDTANTYGVLWTSEAITFYVNGAEHRTITKADMPCIDAPMQLILSTETAFTSDGAVAAAGEYEHRSTFVDVEIYTYTVASALTCPEYTNRDECKLNDCKWKGTAKVCEDKPTCAERTSKKPCKRLSYCNWWPTTKECKTEAPPPKLHACDFPGMRSNCKSKTSCKWNNPTQLCSVDCDVLTKWGCKSDTVGAPFCDWDNTAKICMFKPA